MKHILIILLLFVSVNILSQQAGWVNIGKELGYDFYYKQNTIVRGSNTFVTVAGIPLQEMKDKDNVVIKYLSLDLIFYQSTTGIRCLVTNQLYFYDDKTYKKTGAPKRDLPVDYYSLLLKLYNTIK